MFELIICNFEGEKRRQSESYMQSVLSNPLKFFSLMYAFFNFKIAHIKSAARNIQYSNLGALCRLIRWFYTCNKAYET